MKHNRNIKSVKVEFLKGLIETIVNKKLLILKFYIMQCYIILNKKFFGSDSKR